MGNDFAVRPARMSARCSSRDQSRNLSSMIRVA